MNLAPCITEYSIPEEQTQSLLNLISQVPENLWEQATIYPPPTSEKMSWNEGILRPDWRTSQVFYLTFKKDEIQSDFLNRFDKEVFEVFTTRIKSYMSENRVIIYQDEGYQVLKYDLGGMFNAHIDDFNSMGRCVSGIIYLNDDYEGGELEFSNFNIKIKPKRGSVILFPSNYAYEHRALPVTKGQKLCIVTWFHGAQK